VPILLKHRFPKQYRHPTLDGSLTRARLAGEARALLRCLRSVNFDYWFRFIQNPGRCGVSVPGLRFVDSTSGVLGIEWIDGESVRTLLGSGDQGDHLVDDANDNADDNVLAPFPDRDTLTEYEVSKGAMRIFTAIASFSLFTIHK
jgi:TP53 regulating kinase and related kinases